MIWDQVGASGIAALHTRRPLLRPPPPTHTWCSYLAPACESLVAQPPELRYPTLPYHPELSNGSPTTDADKCGS